MNPFRIPADLGPRFRSPEQVPRRRGVLAPRRDACGSSRGGGGSGGERPHASHADGVRLNGCIARLSGGGADPPYRLRRCPRGLAANRANRADAACFRRALAANRASGAGAGWFRSTATGTAEAPDRPTWPAAEWIRTAATAAANAGSAATSGAAAAARSVRHYGRCGSRPQEKDYPVCG